MKGIYILFAVLLIVLFCAPADKTFAQSSTFNYTGAVQTYSVPLAVFAVGIDAKGAAGGSPYIYFSCATLPVSLGGRVQCALAVTPGEILYLYVGGLGESDAGASPTTGGWNGGGNGTAFGAASGGASDIRLSNVAVGTYSATSGSPGYRVVVAGGGGAGGDYSAEGGPGGGLTGGTGFPMGCLVTGGTPGAGGTQTGPGVGGGALGTLGQGGGSGASEGPGGGGYWGGNGSAGEAGGGGGSSFTDPTLCTSVTHTQGYSGANGNGQIIITILCSTPVAGTIVNPGSVCVGSSGTFSDPTGTAGGVWTSSNTAVATVSSSSGTVTGVSAGTATIVYTIALSCGTAVATSVVTINPLPDAIGGPVDVCVGSTIGLTDGTSGGVWSSTASTVASVNSAGTVTGITQGTATIFYTLSTGCETSSVVTSNNPPFAISGPSSVCMGSTITLSNTATGGAWTSGSPAVATINASGVVTPVSPGETLITYANGCGVPATTMIAVNPLPALITGTTSLCITASSLLSDSTAGGVWSTSASTIASIGSLTGTVTGIAAGYATISYSLITSCAATALVTVIPPLAPITGASTVCVGLTTVLGGSPTGGIWTSGSTANATINPSSGVVTGVSMGTSEITYSTGAGCNAILEMTVNPRAPILGTDSVCAGTSGFLTNIVGGGVWTSSDLSIATTEADSGRIYGIIPGSTIITYFIPTTGCLSSVPVQVIAFPEAITGTTRACPGTSTALVDMVPTGGLWSSNNNFVATVGAATGIVTGVNPDTATVNYIILPGCAVSTLVTINPLPALITGDVYVCPGTIDSLKDATPGGSWSSGSPSLATVIDTSGIVSAVGSGAPVISYTLPTGCFRTKTLSIFPMPAPSVTYVDSINTFFANTSAGIVSYQWYDSIQGLIPGATSPTLAARYGNEYYYVIVTDTNGCKGQSAYIYYNPASVSVKNTSSASQIKIYPNPVNGTLSIICGVKVRAVISSMDGRAQLEEDNAKQIDVSHLPDGVYLIGLYDDSGQLLTTQKITKE